MNPCRLLSHGLSFHLVFFFLAIFQVHAFAYETVVGNDWKKYASTQDLRTAKLFWWFNTALNPNDYVDLVDDPTFGQICRITFAVTAGPDPFGAPRYLTKLPTPMAKMWFRFRVKFSPGWTTVGPLPAGHANSYKLVFWLWNGYDGRGQIEFSNTDDYILGFGVNRGGTYLRYKEIQLPGSQNFGEVTSEWSDGEWYEFVIYYNKTGETSAQQHWWRRRLTQGGVIVDEPFVYTGLEATGEPTPLVRAVELGANKNKITPKEQYIYWGPWEVADGALYPDPFHMFNAEINDNGIHR